MQKPLGQFLIGFLLAFAPAPFVGVGTYAYVQGQAPSPESVSTPKTPRQYGAPLNRDFGNPAPALEFDVNGPASVEPQSGGEMEIETDCARRKRAKKAAAPEKKKPEREVPEI